MISPFERHSYRCHLDGPQFESFLAECGVGCMAPHRVMEKAFVVFWNFWNYAPKLCAHARAPAFHEADAKPQPLGAYLGSRPQKLFTVHSGSTSSATHWPQLVSMVGMLEGLQAWLRVPRKLTGPCPVCMLRKPIKTFEPQHV